MSDNNDLKDLAEQLCKGAPCAPDTCKILDERGCMCVRAGNAIVRLSSKLGESQEQRRRSNEELRRTENTVACLKASLNRAEGQRDEYALRLVRIEELCNGLGPGNDERMLLHKIHAVVVERRGIHQPIDIIFDENGKAVDWKPATDEEEQRPDPDLLETVCDYIRIASGCITLGEFKKADAALMDALHVSRVSEGRGPEPDDFDPRIDGDGLGVHNRE